MSFINKLNTLRKVLGINDHYSAGKQFSLFEIVVSLITTFSVCGKTKSIADAHRNFVKQTGKNVSRSSFRERISNKTLLDFIEKAVLKFSFHILEKVLSAIIEFSVEDSRLKDALTALKDVSSKIDTVFSLCLINRVGEGGTIANLTAAREAGFTPSLNTKTNVGLAAGH